MKDNELDAAVSNLAEGWRKLALETLNPVALTPDVFKAVLTGSCDPIELLTLKPEIESELVSLGKGQSIRFQSRVEPHEASSLNQSINQDFTTAASVLFKNSFIYPLDFRCGLYNKEITPNLHADGSRGLYGSFKHEWDLVGRVGSLPVWAAKQEDLQRADPALLKAARTRYDVIQHNARYGLPNETTEEEQKLAMQALKNQGVLTPLKLGSIYLMQNDSHGSNSITAGCQHASSPVPPNGMNSCFIRSNLCVRL